MHSILWNYTYLAIYFSSLTWTEETGCISEHKKVTKHWAFKEEKGNKYLKASNNKMFVALTIDIYNELYTSNYFQFNKFTFPQDISTPKTW